MESTVTIYTSAARALQPAAEEKCRRRYAPSVWGDFFITHQPCTPEELLSMEEKARVKKEEVRHILLKAASSGDLAQKLDLVDALQRLGVDYHYKEEIDELLRAVYDDMDGGSDDLCVTSLRFYLLRKHGLAVPSSKNILFVDNELRHQAFDSHKASSHLIIKNISGNIK